MDRVIIDNINERVNRDDRLFVLGDFSLEKDRRRYLRRLNCERIWLIVGNHDKRPSVSDGFVQVKTYYEEKFQLLDGSSKLLVMFHYPILEWNGWHKGSWHLYGHVHTKRNQHYTDRLAMDIGVDNCDFKPLCFKDIEKIMSKKKWASPFEKWKKQGDLWKKEEEAKTSSST